MGAGAARGRQAAAERPLPAVAVGTPLAAYRGLYFASVTWAGVTVSTVVSLGVAPLGLTVADALRTRTRPTRGRLAVLATALTAIGACVLAPLAVVAALVTPGPVTAGVAAAVVLRARIGPVAVLGTIMILAEAPDPVAGSHADRSG